MAVDIKGEMKKRRESELSADAPVFESVLSIAALALKFGRVERVTRHEDGIRPETDTDHTVMLAVTACALADRFEPGLRIGLIAHLAIVRDLVEAYAGDTNTAAGLNPEEKAAKEERERLAFKKIHEVFAGTFPWITEMIEKYESLDTQEARLVKCVDKIMPKAMHILNNGAVLATLNYDFYHEEQRQQIRRWAHDMPWLVDLWEQFVRETQRLGTMTRKLEPLPGRESIGAGE